MPSFKVYSFPKTSLREKGVAERSEESTRSQRLARSKPGGLRGEGLGGRRGIAAVRALFVYLASPVTRTAASSS